MTTHRWMYLLAVVALAGTGCSNTSAIPLVVAGGKRRWIAVLYSLGALLILAEILSAQVILSQIGNAVIFCGGTATAWLILRGEAGPQAVS